MLVFLVGVVTGLLVAFVIAYCLGHDIHRRLHETLWFGPDEVVYVPAPEAAPEGEVVPGTAVLGGREEGGVSYAGLTPRKLSLDEIVSNMAGPPKPWPLEGSYPSRKPSGSAVIPLSLGGSSITARAAAKRGTGHPAHSRPQGAWPQRRSCVVREA